MATNQGALALTSPAITGHITVIDGQATTTTQDIATVYRKRHDDVLRVVRKRMIEAGEWRLRNFTETVVERQNPSGGAPIMSPVIRMTKKGFHFVVGKFTGAKAVQHQIAFADEFERMEAELSRQTHDPARMTQAQSLAAEVAAVASRTVFQAVANGQASLERSRWLFGMETLPGEQPKPWCKAVPSDAFVASMASLAERILMPGGLMPTDAELAALASACMQRLNQRIECRAGRHLTN